MTQGLVMPPDVADSLKKKGSKKEKEVVPQVLGLVFWTDGGAQPNPGNAGWGMHGYLFDHAEPTKGTGNPDQVPTAFGYVSKVEKAASDKIKAVTPISYFDGLGSFPYAATNNVAEVTATVESMEIAAKYDVKSVQFFIDSKYVLGGIEHMANWARNGWITTAREPVKNQDLWMRMLAARDALVAKGVKLKYDWVKGHSGVFGNEIADRLANMGVRHSRAGVHAPPIQITEAQGYWKYDTERHAFISHRRMYFNSVASYMVPGEYYLGEHNSDDDMAGKRWSDGAYALVRLTTPDTILEEIRNHTCKMAAGTNSIMLARLDYMYRNDVHEQLKSWGGITLDQKDPERLDLFHYDDKSEAFKEPVAKEMKPPKLVQRTVNAIVEMGEVLNDFIKKADSLVITDLTSIIYETEVTLKKDVEVKSTKLRPEFKVGTSVLPTKVQYRCPDGTIESMDVRLTLGMDLLDRNSLRRLEDTSPTVSLISWSEEPQAFRFAVVIQSKDDIGIWCGYYSNLRIIVPKA